jgi:hypothetical protein
MGKDTYTSERAQINISLMLDHMSGQAHTVQDLVLKIGMAQTTVTRYVRHLYQTKMIHIHRWEKLEPDEKRQNPIFVAAYMKGNLDDTPRQRSDVRTDYKRIRESLTAEELRSILHYNPETGVFTSKTKRGSIKVGDIVGTRKSDDGRNIIRINYTAYFASRLAWLYMTGEWPKFEVDHKDTDPSNDRWENLRDVTSTVNMQNRRHAGKKKHSNLLGAHWCNQRKLWKSSIRVNGGSVHLGVFDSAEKASEAYIDAKRRMHEGCTL